LVKKNDVKKVSGHGQPSHNKTNKWENVSN